MKISYQLLVMRASVNDHSPPAIYETMHDEKSEKDQSDIPDSGIQRHSNSEYVNSADFHDYQEYGRDKSSPGIYQALHDKEIVEVYCDISDSGIKQQVKGE